MTLEIFLWAFGIAVACFIMLVVLAWVGSRCLDSLERGCNGDCGQGRSCRCGE